MSACHSKTNQALGTLERDRILLKAPAAELITQVLARKGQDVKEGDLLMQLDDSRQQILVTKAKAIKIGAEASFKKLVNGARSEEVAAQTALWNQAQIQSSELERQYVRAQNLWEKKLISQADFEKARTLNNSGKADLQRVHQNLLLLTHGSRPEDLAQAKALLDQAESQLQAELRTLADLSIRSSRTGKLDDLPKHLGDRTQIGDVLAVLLAQEAPYARVYIPESVRINITSGLKLNVHIDGIEAPIQGHVRWVSQDPAFTPYYALNSNERSRLVYLAEIDLPDQAKDIPSGIPVQVDLPQ